MEIPVAIVRDEVMEAYADRWDLKDDDSSWEEVSARRNLHFKASNYLSRDEAIAIMQEAVPSYNIFEPHLLECLPEDCQILIAREGSVCIYVKGNIPPDVISDLCADEFDDYGEEGWRIWWD